MEVSLNCSFMYCNNDSSIIYKNGCICTIKSAYFYALCTFHGAKVLLFFDIRKSFVFFLSTFDFFTVIQYVKERFVW